MDPSPGEDLLTITTLVKDLSGRLSESTEKIKHLESLSQSLAKDTDLSYEELSKPVAEICQENGHPQEESEKRLIAKLENERLQLVSKLQQEEYITKKLSNILQQNEELVNSIKDYFKNKDINRRNESSKNFLKINNKLNVMKIQKLLVDENMLDVLTKLEKLSDPEVDEIADGYGEKLSTLLSKLEEVVNRRV